MQTVIEPNSKMEFNRGLPRWADAVGAAVALMSLAPVMAVIALGIWIKSGPPVLFHQKRVGQGGKLFTLVKFRTMRQSQAGPQVTAVGDTRITSIGKVLRRTKLDELPEFWNVLKGDMSLVGPRPEVPRYVNSRDERWNSILLARPGLTDAVTLRLRDEENLLGAVKRGQEQFYLRTLQSYKLDGYLQYLKTRTWRTDLNVLIATVLAILRPRSVPGPTLDEIVRGSDAHGQSAS